MNTAVGQLSVTGVEVKVECNALLQCYWTHSIHTYTYVCSLGHLKPHKPITSNSWNEYSDKIRECDTLLHYYCEFESKQNRWSSPSFDSFWKQKKKCNIIDKWQTILLTHVKQVMHNATSKVNQRFVVNFRLRFVTFKADCNTAKCNKYVWM